MRYPQVDDVLTLEQIKIVLRRRPYSMTPAAIKMVTQDGTTAHVWASLRHGKPLLTYHIGERNYREEFWGNTNTIVFRDEDGGKVVRESAPYEMGSEPEEPSEHSLV